jgi:ATP-binding cassette subfamily F protein 3
MLDEPTNHLDMHSCELLIESLNKYQGSIILVSHDRYFVSKTANKIWEIVDHKIKEFKGGYEEYVEWKERMARKQKEEEANKKLTERSGRELKAQPDSKIEKRIDKPGKNINDNQASAKSYAPAPINKELKKELQKQQRIFQQLEEQIAKMNERKSELEASLVDPATYSDKIKFLEAETNYRNVSGELDKLNAQYEKTFELIVSLEGN